MYVDQDKCIGCRLCVKYCPINAIYMEDKKAHINDDLCTECVNCKRSECCKQEALCENELLWPRQVRSLMSNVKTEYKGVNGRGTEEMKTNDVTHRFKKGYCGVAIELGRPGVSTSLRDLEKVAMAVAKCGVEFEELNPITSYIVDKKTGKLDSDILDERALSGIIEIGVANSNLENVVRTVLDVAEEIDTVLCLDCVCVVNEDDSIDAMDILDKAGIAYSPNCKTNVGLGQSRYVRRTE